jgi:tRNA modification GTPase
MNAEAGSPVPRVCVLTPEGRGAIAVVRVWNEGAVALTDAVFRPRFGGALGAGPSGRLRLGRIGEGLGDEVVAVVVDVQGGPPEVEIHCHGGPAALALVVSALEAAGAERRQPVAWVRHAARSAVAAEAEVDLARAATLRTAEVLLEQAEGALEAEARQALEHLPHDPAAARTIVSGLRARGEVGLRLVSGWRVVLAGRPNVGKSRLLNALAGYDRAIVDPTPGTTRDVVTVRTAFDGWPVELADTAGLRPSDDPIEASGIALARARHGQADLVVLVLDRSEPLTDADHALIAAHPAALAVANKADLPAAWDPEALAALPVSAERGDGIAALAAALGRRLVPDPPPPEAGVPFRPGQVRHLEEAERALATGDLHAAAHHLGALLAPLPAPRSSA